MPAYESTVAQRSALMLLPEHLRRLLFTRSMANVAKVGRLFLAFDLEGRQFIIHHRVKIYYAPDFVWLARRSNAPLRKWSVVGARADRKSKRQ